MLSEDKIVKKIKESAEDITVPEALTPEHVAEKLRLQKIGKRRAMIRRISAAAAAMIVVIGGIGAVELSQYKGDNKEQEGQISGSGGKKDDSETEHIQSFNAAKKTKVGEQYYLSSDYTDVYELYQTKTEEYIMNGLDTDGLKGAELNSGNSSSNIASSDFAADGDYSDTNTMVDGVDESDIVKINDRYLYVRKEDAIDIVDISSKEMKLVGTIHPEMGSSDRIYEMYLDGNELYFMNSCNDAVLNTDETNVYSYDVGYFLNTDYKTTLQCYDVSDPKHPQKLGSITQDGGYYTSRKVGDDIYLFTQKNNFLTGSEEELIPEVNGEKVDSDCIYLPGEINYGFQELIVTSINAKEPDQIVDQMVIVNDFCEIYMSENAIYLYSTDYFSEQRGTKLAKFSYSEGKMDAVNAVLVKGIVNDRFALHETNGVFQILTTEWSAASENQLYLFDEELKELGSLNNIAKGEEIYAARYIGDIVYFITYHNTDPLFAVDISDPENPKELGEVKMTGFSDYLHPYGDGLLLGIGYETDPDTSETLGVKLTMFDISDPVNLKILDTVVIKEANYTRASYDYKTVLADPAKNLIGFNVSGYIKNSYAAYQIYQWENGGFQKVLEQSADFYDSNDGTRGMYCGDYVYLLDQNTEGYNIRQYSIPEGFCETGHLDLTFKDINF